MNDDVQNLTLTALAALAVFLLAVGGVAAHGIDDAPNRDPAPENASAADWATGTERQAIDGAGSDAHRGNGTGTNCGEMGDRTAPCPSGSMMSDTMDRGTSGTGCH